jgi:hypothetical protein
VIYVLQDFGEDPVCFVQNFKKTLLRFVQDFEEDPVIVKNMLSYGNSVHFKPSSAVVTPSPMKNSRQLL